MSSIIESRGYTTPRRHSYTKQTHNGHGSQQADGPRAPAPQSTPASPHQLASSIALGRKPAGS